MIGDKWLEQYPDSSNKKVSKVNKLLKKKQYLDFSWTAKIDHSTDFESLATNSY